ncbi:MAG: HAMP domain-containing sensor histidine kinase [Candidatus Thermoplasmatota archaeon]|jgi:signal transduction histidine kinase|nr:HAMP domain-containing sensor histidine kinase [Candidatus Thermoplasmatota archaeon]
MMVFMLSTSDYQKKLEEELKAKNVEIEELKKRLSETENQLNELNRNLEQKVIDRTLEAKRLLLHINKFIDHLSHDLGTPITPLVTLLPFIKENVTDPKTKELVETCIRSAEYIKRVVKNTQEIAELNAINFYLKRENLGDIVRDLIEKYDVVFKSCNIKVENLIPGDVYVKTERDRLLKVFDHVTSNAVNSMLNGGTLSFMAQRVEKKTGSFIQVSVRDTGVGLSGDQIGHIFDEFYKVDESRHKLDSTGLGLSICKRIVEKHGGHIWAESPGKDRGVTIHFTIPSD